MSKKVILGIVAAVLLLGAENLLAKGKADKPKAKQKQSQKLQQKKKAQAKQLQKQKAAKKASQKAMKGTQQKQRSLRQKQAQPMQRRFDSWFGQLTRAHRQNDREKMGQLLRKMHQFRQRQTKARDAVGERRQDFRSRGRAGKGRHGQLRGSPSCRHGQGLQHTGMGRPDPDMPHRGMGRHGRGFQRRGIGRRQQRIRGGQRGYRNPGFPHRGMHNWRQDSHSSEWDW